MPNNSTSAETLSLLDSNTTVAQAMTGLALKYKDLDVNQAYSAFIGAGGANILYQWPTIQNQRVRAINTLPGEYTKDKVEKMIQNPGANEQALRGLSASLASTTKIYDIILQTYPDIMTYDWYVYPEYRETKPEKKAWIREYELANKIANTLDLKSKTHEIAGKVMEYGKVFYTPRISVDKAHNKVNYAFLQQLPEDYCKIVGFNDGPGKYTVAFNLLYFMIPGNTWQQYGDLFEPYMSPFYSVVESKDKYVYSSTGGYGINTDKFRDMEISRTAGSPEWQLIGTEWCYWVTLPADRVIVYEAVDRNDLVAPPNTGLMISMMQIPNYEAAQLEIVLSPLTSVLTGTIETSDPKGIANADPLRVSPTVRRMYEALWYDMLNANNTAGIGAFFGPFTDMKLQTLSDSVSNTNIASSAMSDQILKSGLSAVVPTTNDPKVGVAQLSAMLQAQYLRTVYWRQERLMNWLYARLGLNMRFRMFGDIFTRKEEMENARKGMTSGLLVDTLKYNAMQGISLLDDLAISDFIVDSGIMDKRLPLVTSYSAKQGDGTLPPQAKKEISEDGRPPEDGSIHSEVTENLRI